jgi:23S rRNA (guanine2445-N2)-methyltransferase / 23S rRNA (guanine2069-N7)-methyltransferase
LSATAEAGLSFTATAPRGLSELMAEELRAQGATPQLRGSRVEFSGTLELGYRACLWSRVASRVYLHLAHFEAADTDAFYAAVRGIDWSAHVDPQRTLACEFSGLHPTITHTRFGALKLKDGVCDQLRDTTGSRPDIEVARPAVRLHAHASGPRITLALDLSGEGLHARGYRLQAGEAPLRENVAAGVLLRAGWPQLSAEGAAVLDPLCGAGTLVIEAALIAARRAPGLTRTYFGFLGWLGHDSELWQRLLAEARAAVPAVAPAASGAILGSDADDRVLGMAAANARRAGVDGLVEFRRAAVADARPPAPTGLVATNPPYGVRLGDDSSARGVHRALGSTLRAHFAGWQVAILTGLPAAGAELQLRTFRTHTIWNGPLECRLLRVDLSRPGTANLAERDAARAAATEAAAESLAQTPGARMFANRVEKNLRRMGRIASRQQVSCYRLYDADMPEYAFAIDRYALADVPDEVHLHVQEYAAPASIDPDAASRRRTEALAALPGAAGVPRERVHRRLRRRQRGGSQYQRLDAPPVRHVVGEGGLRFLVNFEEYLDTGLFLDHRIARARLGAAARGARFLNLFCYTATATVYAAAGGARSTLSVDLSNTYLDWAADNFRLNGLASAQHSLERADCREWLRAAATAASSASDAPQFDLIFLDPPTFSNSARMQGVFDIQRDHASLIDDCMRLLAAGGLLVFSTNAQRFRLDEALTERYALTDVSSATLPFDFERNARIHRCYEIRHR